MWRRRFFLKIYLWFWAATALIILTHMAIDRVTETGPPFDHVRDELRHSLSFYGLAAADLQQYGAIHSLERLTEILKNATGINARMVGSLYASNNLPEEFIELASKAVSTGKMAISHPGGMMIAAVPVGVIDTGVCAAVGDLSFQPPQAPPHRGPYFGLPRIIMALMISGIVCYALTRYLSSPVFALRAATQQFARGDLDARVGAKICNRRDEFSDLANDFNEMAQQIGTLLLLQKQLLTDISHELRSPLARLNVAIELARRSPTADAEKMLDRMAKESDLMNQMIGHVLMLSRLESRTDAIHMQPIDLPQLVRAVVADADFEATAKGCSVALPESERCEVLGNEQLLRSAFENVVRNAVRYTREGTLVEIRFKQDLTAGSDVTVEIRDHGTGIPERHLQHIFRPFYRVSEARDRDTGGVGLGLAITERAIRLHGGTVAVRNAEQGGLVVAITLPLHQKC